MERVEQQRLREYIDAYDRGWGGDGVKIPDFVLDAAKEALALAATDIPKCQQCGEDATWETGGAAPWYFCADHPSDVETLAPGEVMAGRIWRKRYLDLLTRCEAATVPTTIQEMRHELLIALGTDLL